MKGFVMLSLKSNGNKGVTVIADGVKIEGKFYSPGSTRIDGNVTGDIESDGILRIGKEGKVESNIKANNAVIAGDFKGEMLATGEVEITSTGKFEGNLTQNDPHLMISKGGVFQGSSIVNGSK